MDDRTRLVSECHALRAQLKEWEKSFSELNSGRKPGKEDIKENPAIAAKYKKYSRTRDILDGKKKDPYPQRPVSPSVRKHKSTTSSSRRIEQDHDQTPRKILFATPRKPRYAIADSHPNTLDPYDAPSASASPHPYVFKNAIGPTPQRDGKILGLFDLLSNPGSTPSARKRKANILEESPSRVNAAQTPSREHAKGSEDPLHHLGGSSGTRPHRRTPASEGKRFLLSHFFSTPTTMRFAAITDEEPSDAVEKTRMDGTPLRSKVSEAQAKDGQRLENDVESTPVYLRRTTSFNQRLLTASSSNPQSTRTNGDLGLASLSPIRTGPKARPFKCRALSEILRGLRQMEDQDDEDGLDALRELEGNEVNVLVGDSQQQSVGDAAGAGEEPARAWKKRGQKRTTRRVIMRPTTTTAHRSRDRRGLGKGKYKDTNINDDEVARVDETQAAAMSTNQTWPEFLDHADDDLDQLLAEDGDNKKLRKDGDYRQPLSGEEEGNETANHDHDHDSELDELAPSPSSSSTRISKQKRKTPSPPSSPEWVDPDTRAAAVVMSPTDKAAPQPQQQKQAQPGRPRNEKRKKATKKDGDAGRVEGKGKGKEKKGGRGTINPNAHSHLNFRTLKIHHRNGRVQGKGKGKGNGNGRFGGGKRR